MCVALIGGMDRLKPEYARTAKKEGWKVNHIERNCKGFEAKIGSPDLIIVFTGKISHEARRKACQYAKARRIPLRESHTCGLSSLAACLRS